MEDQYQDQTFEDLTRDARMYIVLLLELGDCHMDGLVAAGCINDHTHCLFVTERHACASPLHTEGIEQGIK